MKFTNLFLLVAISLLCLGRVAGAAAEHEYRLAAQDKITVTVLKHPELSGTYVIPPDGALDFPRVGRMAVTGKTVAELSTALRTELGKFLRSPDLAIVVTEPRPRNAYALGAVAKPGQYTLAEGARVTELLAAAGDLAAADRRELTASIVRGQQIIPVRLQEALSGNDPTANLPLQEGDVLWVQEPKKVAVVVSGQVKTPGMLKLLDGSTFMAALAQTGDLTGDIRQLTASISRGKEQFPVDLQAAAAGKDANAMMPLHDGDIIWIQDVPRISIVVFGQVKNPGVLKLRVGGTVVDALAQAGDIVGEKTELTAGIARGKFNLPVDIQAVLSGRDPKADLTLQDGDVLLVQQSTKVSVAVFGQVKAPGMFKLREGSTVTDALAQAGGITSERTEVVASIARGMAVIPVDLQTPTADPQGQLTLREGDVIWVQLPVKVGVVVFGQVRNPGVLKLREGSTVKDALAQAGDLVGSVADLTASVARGATVLPVDLASVMKNDAAANIPLHEGDVLWVQPQARVSVVVSGQVKTPGVYKLRDGTRLVDAMAQAGGVVGDQAQLTANLTRGASTSTINLQTALDGVNPAGNPALHEGDIVWVQERAKITVVVSGQVKNPGAVKLQENSTPVDALAAAGDLTDRPERMRISLLRGTDTTKVTWGDNHTPLHDGDTLLVEKEPIARVYVIGYVRNPGAYELPDGGGVQKAIALAGGTLPHPALNKVLITRAKDNTQESVDITDAMRGNAGKDAKLEPGDLVNISESTDVFLVMGKVRQPGAFPIEDGKPVTLVDAISMAGGQDQRSNLTHVAVLHNVNGKMVRQEINVNDILNKGKQNLNITLKPHDVVYVPESRPADWGTIISGIATLGYLKYMGL